MRLSRYIPLGHDVRLLDCLPFWANPLNSTNLEVSGKKKKKFRFMEYFVDTLKKKKWCEIKSGTGIGPLHGGHFYLAHFLLYSLTVLLHGNALNP